MRCQLSAYSDASHVVNSVHSDRDTINDSLSEREIGGVFSGSSDQIIEAGCCCIEQVYSNDGKLKMLVKLVLRRPDDDDFEVKFL